MAVDFGEAESVPGVGPSGSQTEALSPHPGCTPLSDFKGEGAGMPLLSQALHTFPEPSLFPPAGLHVKPKACISQWAQ